MAINIEVVSQSESVEVNTGIPSSTVVSIAETIEVNVVLKGTDSLSVDNYTVEVTSV